MNHPSSSNHPSPYGNHVHVQPQYAQQPQQEQQDQIHQQQAQQQYHNQHPHPYPQHHQPQEHSYDFQNQHPQHLYEQQPQQYYNHHQQQQQQQQQQQTSNLDAALNHYPHPIQIQNTPTTTIATATNNTDTGTNATIQQRLEQEIQKLKSKLEASQEEVFDLKASLCTVEAESAHKIQFTESKTSQQIRHMQEELQRMDMERNKLVGKLAEEKKRRRDDAKKHQQLSPQPPQPLQHGTTSRLLQQQHIQSQPKSHSQPRLQSQSKSRIPPPPQNQNGNKNIPHDSSFSSLPAVTPTTTQSKHLHKSYTSTANTNTNTNSSLPTPTTTILEPPHQTTPHQPPSISVSTNTTTTTIETTTAAAAAAATMTSIDSIIPGFQEQTTAVMKSPLIHNNTNDNQIMYESTAPTVSSLQKKFHPPLDPGPDPDLVGYPNDAQMAHILLHHSRLHSTLVPTEEDIPTNEHGMTMTPSDRYLRKRSWEDSLLTQTLDAAQEEEEEDSPPYSSLSSSLPSSSLSSSSPLSSSSSLSSWEIQTMLSCTLQNMLSCQHCNVTSPDSNHHDHHSNIRALMKVMLQIMGSYSEQCLINMDLYTQSPPDKQSPHHLHHHHLQKIRKDLHQVLQWCHQILVFCPWVRQDLLSSILLYPPSKRPETDSFSKEDSPMELEPDHSTSSLLSSLSSSSAALQRIQCPHPLLEKEVARMIDSSIRSVSLWTTATSTSTSASPVIKKHENKERSRWMKHFVIFLQHAILRFPPLPKPLLNSTGKQPPQPQPQPQPQWDQQEYDFQPKTPPRQTTTSHLSRMQLVSMQIVLLLLQNTDDANFHELWYQHLLYPWDTLISLLSSKETKIETRNDEKEEEDIQDNSNQETNLVSVFQQIMMMDSTSDNENHMLKIECLRLLSFLISHHRSPSNTATALSLDQTKKIASTCMQCLNTWIQKTLQPPLSQKNDTDHNDASEDMILQIMDLLQTLCQDWNNGVSTLFLFYPIIEESNDDSKLLSSISELPLSGIGILIQILDILTSHIFHTSFANAGLSNYVYIKWKQMLSKVIGVFYAIVEHTQHLRQKQEQDNVDVKKWVSFLSVIQEKRDIFCACCELVYIQNDGIDTHHHHDMEDINDIDKKLIHRVKVMLDEIAYDEEEIDQLHTS